MIELVQQFLGERCLFSSLAVLGNYRVHFLPWEMKHSKYRHIKSYFLFVWFIRWNRQQTEMQAIIMTQTQIY